MYKQSLAAGPLALPEQEQALPTQKPAQEQWVQEEEKLRNERLRWETERARQSHAELFPGVDLKRIVL